MYEDDRAEDRSPIEHAEQHDNSLSDFEDLIDNEIGGDDENDSSNDDKDDE